jgi:hypothetical protein
MSETSWEMSHSVEVRASPRFAWAYMTNVANWDDPPATFELDGPFTAGAQGLTRMPGQEPRQWRIADCQPPESYVMETALDGAGMAFEWRFEGWGEGTRLTQRVMLRGENAGAYLVQVREIFGATLAPGMARIAAAMDRAADESRSG